MHWPCWCCSQANIREEGWGGGSQNFVYRSNIPAGGGGGILYRVLPQRKFRTSQMLSALEAKGNLGLRNFGRQRVAANIAFQCQRICRAYPQACALLLMRHQHTLAPSFGMIMPRKKPKRVLRWLTQAQFHMGKIPHLPSKNEGNTEFSPQKIPPAESPPPRQCGCLLVIAEGSKARGQ